MTAKIKILQYVIFIEPRKFDTADIRYFIVAGARAVERIMFKKDLQKGTRIMYHKYARFFIIFQRQHSVKATSRQRRGNTIALHLRYCDVA